jgi:hypothetical protein
MVDFLFGGFGAISNPRVVMNSNLRNHSNDGRQAIPAGISELGVV